MTKDGDDSQSKETIKLAKQNQARNSNAFTPSMVTPGQLPFSPPDQLPVSSPDQLLVSPPADQLPVSPSVDQQPIIPLIDELPVLPSTDQLPVSSSTLATNVLTEATTISENDVPKRRRRK